MPTLRARILTPAGPDAVRWLPDGILSFDDAGRITEVAEWDGREVDEDLRPGVLLPGFVDAHVHFPQARVVGRASGPLLDWLEHVVFPEEARYGDPEHAAPAAVAFCETLARAGTTTAVVYGSVHAEAADLLLEALSDFGLRAAAGPVLMDQGVPDDLRVRPSEALPALERLAERWHGADDGRLEVAVVPRFAVSCTREMLRGAGDLARRLGLMVTTHLAENTAECDLVRERFGAPDYLSVYEDAGLVHDRTLLAHCIHLDDDAWERLGAAGAAVAHCPDSNAFLGSGHMPVDRARAHGVPLAIGTDVAAGRTFRVPRILSAAYDNGLERGVTLSPAELLWLGTRGGARVLGRDTVGALEPGLEADMVLHDVPTWAGTEEAVLGHLLFDHDAPGPLRTWVRGRTVWQVL
ncbi:MAG: guanine deaminase [Myxococcota bacterium]